MQKLLGRLLLAVISLMMSLVFAEAGFRYYSRMGFNNQVKHWDNPLFKIEPHDPIEFSLHPNTQRKNKTPGTKSEWTYKINSDGFRGHEIGQKSDNVKRVLFLGDSYTFGWDINDSETYPEQLERLLSPRIESVNVGVVGYNTVQESSLLKIVAHKFRPDIIVLGYMMNDAEPQANIPVNPDVKYRYAKSWAIEALKSCVGIPSYTHSHSEPYFYGFQSESPKWRESKKALSEIAEFCKQQDIPILVAILPDLNDNLNDSYMSKIIHARVSEWCDEFGIGCFDLLPYFMGQEHKELTIGGIEHPNAKAHREMAELLVDPIEELL